MQKKIIALAVAALASSAAFAQTNVTVYGVVDLSQSFVKSSGGYEGNGVSFVPGAATGAAAVAYGNQPTVGRLDNNSSYIGFKGVEDLGNGLKAVFQYESNIKADEAGAVEGGRDTFVGLTGGFGTVVGGTLTHPLRAMGAKVELLPGAAGFGTMASLTGTVAGMQTGADNRAKNAIAYVSPTFSGFSGTVAYVNGENKNNSGVNNRQWQLAAQYENGPLFVAAGYHRATDYVANVTEIGDSAVYATANTVGLTSALAAKDGADVSIMRLAAAYTLPTNTKLTFLVDRTKADAGFYDGSTAEVKRTAFSLGVAQTFGKNVAGLEYGRTGKLKVDGDKVDETSANIWTAMYGYNLSKRTMLHARYSRLSNQDGVNNNFYLNPVGQGVTTGPSSTYSGFSLGLRHSF
jgi:predicted porin